jgi:protein transport protein SEC61 subunit gamma-like protein
MELTNFSSFLRTTFKSWDRVLKLSRKPRRQEFIAITKVTGLGAIVVGVIGFVIRMIVHITSRLM